MTTDDTLKMDELLRVETWMHRASRSALHYELKADLISLVDRCWPGPREGFQHDWETARRKVVALGGLLHPIAVDDRRCHAAQHLLCAALAEHCRDQGGDPDAGHGVARVVITHEHGCDGHEPVDRRLLLLALMVQAHGQGDYEAAWPVMRDALTSVRALVLGLTASMVHEAARDRLVRL